MDGGQGLIGDYYGENFFEESEEIKKILEDKEVSCFAKAAIENEITRLREEFWKYVYCPMLFEEELTLEGQQEKLKETAGWILENL
jgi:hypothetical protein